MWLFLFASPAVAHGIGGRGDLPVPLPFFVVGAATVIIASFLALSALWREPRFQPPQTSQPARRWPTWARPLLRLVGLSGLLLVVVAGVLNSEQSTRSIGPVVVWVYFWLVVPFAGAFVGNLWRWISPWRTLAFAVNGGRAERVEVGRVLGIWPAALGLLGFTWLEIVSPNAADPRTLALAALIYSVILIASTQWLGPETGLRAFGAFENYTRVLAAISPYRIEEQADRASTLQPVQRARWLASLPALEPVRGFAPFLTIMIGTVTYDGISASEWWAELVGDLRRSALFDTAGLVGAVVLIGAGYLAAAWVAARLAGAEGTTGMSVASRFAHTLVPIALAYAFAHYFTLIVFEGQLLIHDASDPFGLGWDLFGTAGWRIVFWMSPTTIWLIQVFAIVIGHVAGVVLAHDRALEDFGPQAVRSQYAMLALMVSLTSLGLFILAA